MNGELANDNFFILRNQSATTGTSTSHTLNTTNHVMDLVKSGGISNSILMDTTQLYISSVDDAYNKRIAFSKYDIKIETYSPFNATTRIVTLDTLSLSYGGDYSASYNNQSLVDKQYVDTHLSGTTFTNSPSTNNVPTFNGTNWTFQSPGSTIIGTTTNDNAATGNIGQEIVTTVSTYTNYTTTATYQEIGNIALTAGDWDIAATFTIYTNSATVTAASDAIFVIATATASATGAVEGKSIAYVPQTVLGVTSHITEAMAPFRVSLSGNQSYYLNSQSTFTVGNPQFVGTIRARRIR